MENCGVQTLSKSRFFFAAEFGTGPRWPSLPAKYCSVRVVARKYSRRSRVVEGHFGELKCAYGSHDEFLVLLFFRVLIIRASKSCVSLFDWP